MYLERSEDFKSYALGDLMNFEILQGHIERLCKPIYKLLNIPFRYQDVSYTVGATVNYVVKKCLLKTCSLTSQYQMKMYTMFSNFEYFMSNRSSTSIYLTKTTGGRCYNNQPTHIYTEGTIVDIDISGCYGNRLKNQQYPVGRPMIISYSRQSKYNQYTTLREFLKRYSNELVPGLWFARVSTKRKLTIPQDFLLSWRPPENINDYSISDTVLQGDDTALNNDRTKVLSHNIELGVIQEDFIDWLMNICSPKQRTELLDKLEVATAAFYPKSERKQTFEEFEKAVKNHRGVNTCEAEIRERKRIISINEECHAWYAINFEDLIVGDLLEERRKYDKRKPDQKPINEFIKLMKKSLDRYML